MDLKITDIWQQNLIHLYLISCVLSDYATLNSVSSSMFNEKCLKNMQKNAYQVTKCLTFWGCLHVKAAADNGLLSMLESLPLLRNSNSSEA